jgi:hypothetical protein
MKLSQHFSFGKATLELALNLARKIVHSGAFQKYDFFRFFLFSAVYAKQNGISMP